MNKYDSIDYRPIVIYLSTIHTIMNNVPQKDRSNALALYLFYYHNAIMQKTNRVWCNNSFVEGRDKRGIKTGKGLGWNTEKTTRIRKHLQNIGLIRPIKIRNEKGSWSVHCVELIYCARKRTAATGQWKAIIADQQEIIEKLKIQINELKINNTEKPIKATTRKNPCMAMSDTNAYRVIQEENAYRVSQRRAGQKPLRRRVINKTNNKHHDRTQPAIFPVDNKIPSKETQCAIKWTDMLWKALVEINKLDAKSSQSQWESEFLKMLTEDGRERKRVGNVLRWYIANYGKQYVQTVHSAKKFRERFLDIESLMERLSKTNDTEYISPEEVKQDNDPLWWWHQGQWTKAKRGVKCCDCKTEKKTIYHIGDPFNPAFRIDICAKCHHKRYNEDNERCQNDDSE